MALGRKTANGSFGARDACFVAVGAVKQPSNVVVVEGGRFGGRGEA